MVFGMVDSKGYVLKLGVRSANCYKEAVHMSPLVLAGPNTQSRVVKRGALLLAASAALHYHAVTQSCKYKVTMPAFVQPTVERLDKPSAYYLGRVSVCPFA